MNIPSLVETKTMSSREIAKLLDKRHDNILEGIKTFLTRLNLNHLNFEAVESDAKG